MDKENNHKSSKRMTLFEHLCSSENTFAESVVYRTRAKFWTSPFTVLTFRTKEEAIEETLKELNTIWSVG